MGLEINGCLQSAVIAGFVDPNCRVDWGQTWKVAFQKTRTNTNAFNEMAEADAILLATWTALLATTDETRVQMSPKLGNPIMTPGGENTFGGGNLTPGGTLVQLQPSASVFTSALYQQPQIEVVKAMKALKNAGELGVFYINGSGKIVAQKLTQEE